MNQEIRFQSVSPGHKHLLVFMATEQQASWQLRMFRKTLKKQQRFRVLRQMLGHVDSEKKLLLVTCGDNNGAMNWHLRKLGGKWSWADIEDKSLKEMSELLKENVHHVRPEHLPFADESFDCVVTIDVHEHLSDPRQFTREVTRVTKSNGRVIVTVPSGDRRKWVNILKHAVGMTKEEYGHTRDGYSADELKQLMVPEGLESTRVRTFSRFFTELVELALNFAYVRKLSKKSPEAVAQGTIAPATERQLNSVRKAYRIYSFLFPFTWLFSKLDLLLFYTRGYVVVVEARKRVVA